MGLFDRSLGGTPRDHFAKLVMDGIRAVNPSAELHYDKSNYRLILVENGREQGYVNLGNLFAEYCAKSPEEQDAHI